MNINTLVGLLLFLIPAPLFAQSPKYSELYYQRASLFDTLGVDSTSIVFLGNSLTHGCEWHELFNNPNIVNRGINGDIVQGIQDRLTAVTSGHPAKIFLLIGANDVSHDLTPDSIITAVDQLLDSIQQQTPSTRIYLQSLLPINNSFGRYKLLIGKEDTIRQINKSLEQIAQQRNITFINLYPHFADQDGNLRKDLTNDGLHLLGHAYLIWRDILIPYIYN